MKATSTNRPLRSRRRSKSASPKSSWIRNRANVPSSTQIRSQGLKSTIWSSWRCLITFALITLSTKSKHSHIFVDSITFSVPWYCPLTMKCRSMESAQNSCKMPQNTRKVAPHTSITQQPRLDCPSPTPSPCGLISPNNFKFQIFN